MDANLEGLKFRFGNNDPETTGGPANGFRGPGATATGSDYQHRRNPIERRVNSQDPRVATDQPHRIEMKRMQKSNRLGYNCRDDIDSSSLSNPPPQNGVAYQNNSNSVQQQNRRQL